MRNRVSGEENASRGGRGDVDETGAKVRRSGLCEAIKKPRAAKGGKGQMLQPLPAYGGRAAFFRAIPD